MRVVLDTNQLIAALMRPADLATLMMAWESARFTVLASQALLDEYERVLVYPEIAPLIRPQLLRAYRNRLLPRIERLTPADIPPICRDPDDDKFIAAAAHGLADYLVTVAKHLLATDVVSYLRRFGVGVIDSDDSPLLLDQQG